MVLNFILLIGYDTIGFNWAIFYIILFERINAFEVNFGWFY